jgi:phosphodiesterase/alkaline phosphatase D-like protein
MTSNRPILTRRRFIAASASTAAITLAGGIAKPYLSRAADRPAITHGLQSGDLGVDSGVVWARADRPARMQVEISTTESFRTIRHGVFADALPESDFTAKVLLEDLPSGQDIFYRIRFQDLFSPTLVGEPMVGRFRTGRATGARSPSSGRATPSARAGASTSRAAACAPTRPCATIAPISSFIPATRSMPTGR